MRQKTVLAEWRRKHCKQRPAAVKCKHENICPHCAGERIDMKNRLAHYYKKRHVDYAKEVSGFFISRGVAYVPMHLESKEDVLSRYSVEGVPYLNGEFLVTLDSITEHIPEDLPLVLELSGYRFTPEEQKTVEKAIRAQYALRLGAYEYGQKGLRLRMLWFFLYLAAFFTLLFFKVLPSGIPYEIAYLLFYSLGDRFLESVFLARRGSNAEKLWLGQMSSMKIVFAEAYDPRQLTREEAASLTEEVTETAKQEAGE